MDSMRSLGIVFFLAGASCQLVSGIDDVVVDTGSVIGSESASSAGGGSIASTGGAGAPNGSGAGGAGGDAGATAGSAGMGGCSGTPLKILDVSMYPNHTCNLDGAMANGDGVAGLDYPFNAPMLGALDGVAVTGCIAADF